MWLYQSSHDVIRDSYFFTTQNHGSQSYGVEPWVTSDDLVENNIFQQISSAVLFGSGEGLVIGYNFSVNDWYDATHSWQQNSFSSHNAGSNMNLWEGNSFEGSIYCDSIHGTSDLDTYFRNRLTGRGHNNTYGLTTTNTFAVALQAGCRGFNIIGNVLGTSSYHNNYQITSGTTNCDTSIYMLNFSGTECGTSSVVPTDTLVASTLMRWGNYDTVNAAVRWDSTESSPGTVTYIGVNSTPANHTLPNSFYLSAKPAWWNSNPFPGIGPDVSSGTGPGGFSYINPAQSCYNSISGPADGTGSVLSFDASTCYTLTVTTTSLPGGTQNAAYSTTLAATSGTTPYTWSITSGTLPTGLSLASSTGVISGTPTATGTSNITVQATDANSLTATKALSLTVAAPPTVSTTSLPAGTQNTAYSTTLAATSGTTPYTWSITSGTLPTGLSLASGTGVISGTPTGTGTSNITVQVSDANSSTATKALSLTINAAGIGLVQSNAAQGSAVSSVSVAFSTNNTAGNLIIAFVRMSTTSQTVTLADSAGNTYTQAVAQSQTSDGSQVRLFYAKNIVGAANTVTATFSASNNHPWLAIYEYRGLSTTSPLDQTASAQNFSSAPSSGATGTTTGANELIFGGFGFPASYSGTQAAGSGFTLAQNDTSTSPAANESKLVTATGSYTATFSLGSSANWSAVVATFK